MAFRGQEIIPIATAHVGERYVLGSRAPVLNPNWRGPWDCAEFATWCTYQTYQILFGAEPRDARIGDAYTGYWWNQSETAGRRTPVAEALASPGAFLLRQPRRELIGHIAISLGDGRIVEAAGRNLGVVLRANTPDRRWDSGFLLPGVGYDTSPSAPAWTAPTNILRVTDPYMRGPQIAAVQRALAAHGYDPGDVDGVYGELTEAAVIAFQTERGLVVDGEVGPTSARELNLAWPLKTSADDDAAVDTAATEPRVRPSGEPPVVQPPPLGRAIDFTFHTEGRRIFAVADGDSDPLLVGRSVTYRTHGQRCEGLYQHASDLPMIRPYGMYNRLAEFPRFGVWSHFIWPTVMAESGGYYARFNSYDAGFMTFGLYQLAAHTPGENLAELFRALAGLPESDAYFPEITLRNGKLHRKTGAVPEPLETTTTAFGFTTSGLALLLNPNPLQVDADEQVAAARLVHWTRQSAAARAKQVETAVAIAKRKLQESDRRLGLAGQPLSRCIWVSDIRHQGRAKFSVMAEALRSSDPDRALMEIGISRYRERIETVKECIDQLTAEGTIAGKTYEDLW